MSRNGSLVGPATRLVRSRSPEETQMVGRRLARSVAVPGVVLLCGPLGTGKTTLARGLAEGFGLEDPAQVHSPSFTIVNIYHGRCPIYHVDLYRLSGARDLNSVGLEDFLGRDGITIVEWGERLTSAADAALLVHIEDAGDETRLLHIVKSNSGRSLSKARKPRIPRKPRK